MDGLCKANKRQQVWWHNTLTPLRPRPHILSNLFAALRKRLDFQNRATLLHVSLHRGFIRIINVYFLVDKFDPLSRQAYLVCT